jgi:hypothetical protein
VDDWLTLAIHQHDANHIAAARKSLQQAKVLKWFADVYDTQGQIDALAKQWGGIKPIRLTPCLLRTYGFRTLRQPEDLHRHWSKRANAL